MPSSLPVASVATTTINRATAPSIIDGVFISSSHLRSASAGRTTRTLGWGGAANTAVRGQLSLIALLILRCEVVVR